MISEEEINLWLKSNRLVVMQVDDYVSYRDKNLQTAKQLAHTQKLLDNSKKKRASLRRRLLRLKTDFIKSSLCILASVKKGNSNTQPQTP